MVLASRKSTELLSVATTCKRCRAYSEGHGRLDVDGSATALHESNDTRSTLRSRGLGCSSEVARLSEGHIRDYDQRRERSGALRYRVDHLWFRIASSRHVVSWLSGLSVLTKTSSFGQRLVV